MRGEQKDKRILLLLTLLGLFLFPFTMKKRSKDWLLVFFIHGYFSMVIASIVTGAKLISFPVRLFPRSFKSSVLFDALLFPITAVLYNQWTIHSNFMVTLCKGLFISIALMLLETWFVTNTRLILYKKWSWKITFVSVTLSLYVTRAMIGMIRLLNEREQKEQT
ncbi:CBO0543 family protein [Bacillus spongiae]|uniref:CBO0543 family protein n=1 Tax=Bacillus spongiae TaxID=2683610 RepID=A0ABU8HBS4_9BACI